MDRGNFVFESDETNNVAQIHTYRISTRKRQSSSIINRWPTGGGTASTFAILAAVTILSAVVSF